MPRFRSLVTCAFWLLVVLTRALGLQLDDLAKKADAGDAEAQFELGRAYDEGNGVAENGELAAKWYKRSAEQGNAKAQNSLGILYSRGRGVPRDKEEAFRWYQKAAKQGLPEADFNVAGSYYNGDGVASDLNRAYAWMLIAKRHGSTAAEQGLPRLLEELQGRTDYGTWFLGLLYEKGEETPKDSKAAFDTYLGLTESGQKQLAVEAQYKLCRFYAAGAGVPEDPAQAKSWCKTAAGNGNSSAMIYLGRTAENGVGGEKDLKEAEHWYRDAASELAAEGFMSMGRLKLQGSSHEDQYEAYYWFYLATLYKVRDSEEQAHKAAANLSSDEITKAQKKAVEWSRTPRWKRGKP